MNMTSQKQNQVWERWVMAARGESRIEVVGQKTPRRG